MTTTVPSDDAIAAFVEAARVAEPGLGYLKIYAALKRDHPDWSLSEKRFKKVAQTSSSSDGTALVARTGLDPSIRVQDVAPKVDIKLFPGGKGKGLVAKAKIYKGEVLWQEDPWVSTADQCVLIGITSSSVRQLRPFLTTQQMCTTCLSMFPQPNPALSVACPSCHTAHFCNRLCLSRAKLSGAHHDLMCPAKNPGCADLLKYIASNGSRHLDATSRIVALWLSERSAGNQEVASQIERRVWGGMARINQMDKEKERKEWCVQLAAASMVSSQNVAYSKVYDR